MPGAVPSWWRFLPAGQGSEDSAPEQLAAAAERGRGTLSRALRECRAQLGSSRAATRLRSAEAFAGRRFGRPLRLLLVTGQQPRSVEDALVLAFAIAGFAVKMRAIEGVTALRAALEEKSPESFDGVDLGLVALPSRAGGAQAFDASLEQLAARIGDRCRSPVAVARFIGSEPQPTAAPEPVAPASPVTSLPVILGGHALFDDRFATSFGAMLTPHAADLLADAAAAFAARMTGLAPKLVITDLDGTLWQGILGEGEAVASAAPPIHRAYAEALAGFVRRGLVLAVASRNDPADVARAFFAAALPLAPGDIAARAIGWADKDALVADILAELALGSEHAVFIDDDPVNCARVADRFPDMDVRHFSGDPDLFGAALAADPLLSLSPPTSTERTRSYRLRAAVELRRAESPDMASFLEGLATTVTIVPLEAPYHTRAAELAVRVNQFRFTAFSPTVPVLAERRSPFDFLLRLDDAFGPHGLVGLVLAQREGDAARIDNLFLSCRALGRRVETAMLAALAQIARRQGLARIVGRIESLPRNEPARECLFRHGFVDEGGVSVYLLDAAPQVSPALDDVPEGVTMNWAEWPTEGRT